MDIIISNSSSLPIYEQIKEQFKNKIISNDLKVGEILPSIRSLAKELKISVITTKTAYEELEKEGYIVTMQGKGCFVANKNVQLIKEEQLQRIESLFENAINIAKLSKISKDEMEEILNILYERDEENE